MDQGNRIEPRLSEDEALRLRVEYGLGPLAVMLIRFDHAVRRLGGQLTSTSTGRTSCHS